MGELTMMERALIRPMTPWISWISICRLPLGQFAFKGHAIAMVNDVKTIAETLPRRVADSGVTLLVGPGGLDDALKNPEFVRTYRVRKAKAERTLVLLFRHHAYMSYLYPEGVNLAAMGDLPADGVPAGLTLLQEERF